MGVSGQVFEQLLGSGERRFRIDHPVGGACLVEQCLEGLGRFEMADASGELQLLATIGFGELFQEAAAEITRQDLDRREEGVAAGFPLAVRIEAGVGDHYVSMWMPLESLVP